jgi:branched chain amino acid efflux pump
VVLSDIAEADRATGPLYAYHAAVAATGSGDAAVAAAALPVAAAIGVFGLVYGAVADPVLGSELTLASSIAMFSGAAQFTMVGLLASNATAGAVVVAVVPLALRHIPLGALVQHRLASSRVRRAVVSSLFLTDETVGLALTQQAPAARTMAITGGLAYIAWVIGTAAGVAGASVGGAEEAAAALFPVLFIGLAAVTASTWRDAVRAVAASAAAAGVLMAAPAAGVLGALAVAIGVACLGVRR